MPRRPTLSPSKLTCYLACPHKYYWTYVNPKGQWFLKTHRYFTFGQSLHRTLEAFHRNGDTGVPVREALAAALEENWLDSGYTSADEQEVAFGRAKEIVERVADQVATTPSTTEVLYIEKSLRKPMGDWDLIGRADRIDRHCDEPETLDVVDYKSGRDSVTEEDIAQDVAMSSYALMVRDLFPSVRIRGTIHALRANRIVSHDFSNDELDEFAVAVREVGDGIFNHHWEEMPPVRKALCAKCDFLPLCKRVPGFDEVGDDG